MEKKTIWLVVSSLTIIFLLVTSCAPMVTEKEEIVIPNTTAEITEDVEYGRVGNISLLLDMYIPETPIVTPMPAVVFIHGGGWRGGGDSGTHDQQEHRAGAAARVAVQQYRGGSGSG